MYKERKLLEHGSCIPGWAERSRPDSTIDSKRASATIRGERKAAMATANSAYYALKDRFRTATAGSKHNSNGF